MADNLGSAPVSRAPTPGLLDLTDDALDAERRAQVAERLPHPRQQDSGVDLMRVVPAQPGSPDEGSVADPVATALRAVPDLTPAPSVEELLRAAGVGTLPGRAGYDAAKRALDIALAVPLLALTAPVMLGVAYLVRRDSAGPALFRQERVGRGGRTFRFYKFRTMHVDARERFPQMYAYDFDRTQIKRMCFKLADDPRLTRFGRVLRRTSIDELPNLINVLRGDMSLVGPRPDIAPMIRFYTPEQLVKLTVKPGLTGLAQTSGRNILTFQQTLTWDVDYVRRRSLALDLRLLVRTVVVVVTQLGAL